MHNLPIRVDLSNFFTDARSCCLLLVDATWMNVKDLQDHIQKLFQLNNINLLTNDGCYLPPKESIEVIVGVESVKAFQLNFNKESEYRSLQNVAEISRKRKNRSVEVEIEHISSTPNFPKRSKCKTVSQDKATFMEASSKPDKSKSVRGKAPKKNKSKRQNDEFKEESKRPNVSSTQLHNEVLTSNQSMRMQTTKTDAGNQSSVKATNSFNKHTIYQDDEMETETAMETSCPATRADPQVEFRCPLMELDSNLVRIFKLPRKLEPIKILEVVVLPAPVRQISTEAIKDAPVKEAEILTAVALAPEVEGEQKQSTPVASARQVEEDSTVLEEQSIAKEPTPVAEQSLLTSDSEDDVMVLDDTNLDDSNDADVQPVPVQKDESLDIIADMLQNAAPLANLPNVGETLIFKLAKSRGQLQAKRSNPSLTDYIAGTCSYVNRRTKLITIHLIAYARHINHVLLQYTNNCDSSYDSTLILNVSLKELIDAKVIVSEVY